MDRHPALAGAAAALLASLLLRVFRTADLTDMNLELMTGSLLTGTADATAWRLGLLVHGLLGAAFGGVYAALFRALRLSGPQLGVAVAAYHAVLTGVLLPIQDAAHPLVRSGDLRPAGPFAAELGMLEPALLVGAHLLYGAVVGLLLPATAVVPARPRSLTEFRR